MKVGHNAGLGGGYGSMDDEDWGEEWDEWDDDYNNDWH